MLNFFKNSALVYTNLKPSLDNGQIIVDTPTLDGYSMF